MEGEEAWVSYMYSSLNAHMLPGSTRLLFTGSYPIGMPGLQQQQQQGQQGQQGQQQGQQQQGEQLGRVLRSASALARSLPSKGVLGRFTVAVSTFERQQDQDVSGAGSATPQAAGDAVDSAATVTVVRRCTL